MLAQGCALATLQVCSFKDTTLKGLCLLRESQTRRNSFRVAMNRAASFTQGFKANPGLELANAFSVRCFFILDARTHVLPERNPWAAISQRLMRLATNQED